MGGFIFLEKSNWGVLPISLLLVPCKGVRLSLDQVASSLREVQLVIVKRGTSVLHQMVSTPPPPTRLLSHSLVATYNKLNKL